MLNHHIYIYVFQDKKSIQDRHSIRLCASECDEINDDKYTCQKTLLLFEWLLKMMMMKKKKDLEKKKDRRRS